MTTTTTTTTTAPDSYARKMAAGMLYSLEHYGWSCPAVGDGRVSTPAYYASKLGLVLSSRRDILPGTSVEWWGARFAAYARQLLEA